MMRRLLETGDRRVVMMTHNGDHSHICDGGQSL